MEITVGLDWTANTAHAALLVAEGAGFNKEVGLAVSFVEATASNAPPTPLDGVVAGTLTFGLAPCDQILQEKVLQDRIHAVAALHDQDISAVCVLEESSIHTPANLSNKKYGSCGYAYEVACINGMIKHDGGEGVVREVCPPARPETELLLLENKVDCVWMYRTWEVLRAEDAGISLREFVPGNFGVPFGYMNCVIASKVYLATTEGQDTMRKFLSAASKAAVFVADNPEDAARIIASMAGSKGISKDCGLDNPDFNLKSIKKLIELKALLPVESDRSWGEMKHERWNSFVKWVESMPEITFSGIDISTLYTNKFLRL